MGKAGPLRTSTKALVVAMSVVVAGCARQAVNLPPEIGDDRAALSAALGKLPDDIKKMSCFEIKDDYQHLAKHDADLEQRITANRGKDQAAALLTGFIVPAMASANRDDVTKKLLDDNQIRRDHLIVAMRANSCPSSKDVSALDPGVR